MAHGHSRNYTTLTDATDPNGWAKDGATALDAWEPSPNGKLIAYTVQDGGSDWRTIKVIDVKTGKPVGEPIAWAKFTNLAWVGNEGFLYSRFAEPEKGKEFQALNENQTLYFHRIGTAQSEDKAVYATPDRPKLGHSAQVTHDGRWVVITSAEGTDDKYELNLMPLAGEKREWKVRPLVPGLDHDWQLIEGMSDTLYFVTNKAAPKLRVVSIDLNPPLYKCNDGVAHYEVDCSDPVEFKEVIPEREETLSRAQIVGNRLVLSYLKDAATIAEMVSLDGQPVKKIELNAIGTASGFSGKPGDPETFFPSPASISRGRCTALTVPPGKAPSLRNPS